MANLFVDVVKFVPTAGGTTDFTPSAAVQGYRTPGGASAANGTYSYRAENSSGTEWENGIGTWNGTVLARTTITASSNANAKVSFTTAPNVGFVESAADIVDASIFSAGTVPTARLGSGTANSGTFLRGDSSWAAGLRCTSLTASTDLNTVQDPGNYDVSSPTNGPVSGVYLYVEVRQYSGYVAGTNVYVSQTAYDLTDSSNRAWVRTCVNGTWTSWRPFASGWTLVNSTTATTSVASISLTIPNPSWWQMLAIVIKDLQPAAVSSTRISFSEDALSSFRSVYLFSSNSSANTYISEQNSSSGKRGFIVAQVSNLPSGRPIYLNSSLDAVTQNPGLVTYGSAPINAIRVAQSGGNIAGNTSNCTVSIWGLP